MNAETFEMTLKGIFRLEDGVIVLVGPCRGELSAQRATPCEVRIDDRVVGHVTLEGPVMMEGSHPEGFRAVAARDSMKLSEDVIREGRCRIRAESRVR
jgi:hypothetical protein